MKAGENNDVNAYFIGSIVYIEKGLYQITSQSPLLVIDGQQRLTTISLLIAALADELESLPSGNKEIIEGFSPKKLRNYYLLNPEEELEGHFKLILSKKDKETLKAIIKNKAYPKEYSNNVVECYWLFRKWLSNNSSKLVDLCKGIAKLIIVDVSLTRGEDNPQLIFESMNSTGKELTQADLIRNFVLM